MSSPRKYASPYLTGLPGLPTSTGTGATSSKPKKKSKTSITKLSESAAAIKQIQDGIWRNAKESSRVSSRITSAGDQASPRQETSFDDASSCGEKLLDEIQEADDASELTPSTVVEEEKEEPEVKEDDTVDNEQDVEDVAVLGASALVASKDSILLKQGNLRNSNKEEESTEHWGVPPEEQDNEEKPEEEQPTNKPVPIVLKSILKKPSVYQDKVKAKGPPSKKSSSKNTTPKGKYGRPVKEQQLQVTGTSTTRVSGRQAKNTITTELGPMRLEVHNKFSNAKLPAKSPRKNSKTSGRLGGARDTEKMEPTPVPILPKKAVRFSNRIDVHAVPYEPRAGSRACDWQRNMLEQRVLTFRQLMKEVGNAEDIDIFGNGMLFPGYSSYPVPNPNFALRGTNAPSYGSGLVGMPPPPGMGRSRNNHFNM